MIRFSAALVAVAIGVLIGGIATSKLLLVYIAIVVSAVALVVLAVGVALKRQELFGEAQGLVPAGAGAAPVLPGRAGESQAQPRPDASVPPSAPFPGAAAGSGAAFAGTAAVGLAQAPPPAPPPVTAAGSSAPRQAPDGPGRERAADPVPSWEAQSARDQWSSSPRPGSTAAGPAPDWMPGGRGASEPVGLAGENTPLPSSTVSRTPPAPSGRFSAGPGSASPNWFAPQARPADAVPAASHAPADADEDPADEDDDWPGRYSWLDDESEAGESTDETDQAGAPADLAPERDAGDAAPVRESPASAGQDPDLADEAAEAADAGVDAAVAVATDAEPDPAPAESELAPAEAELAPAEPESESAEPQPASAGSEPPSAGAQDPGPGDGLVAVLHGVPRYHRPDCVLIRFMPEADIKRMPAEQASADGCTPCAACQPAE